MSKINIIFLGTPKHAAYTLQELAKNKKFKILCAVTQPDKKKGRGQKIIPSYVKQEATRLGIEVFQPKNINTPSFIKKLKNKTPHAIVAAAYGQFLNNEILNIPIFEAINIHYSLLPRYRGASPIENALLNEDKETGVSIIRITEKMDAGDIFIQAKLNIKKEDNKTSLTKKLSRLGTKLLIKTLTLPLTPTAQDESKATFCKKIKKKDGRIAWKNHADKILAKIKAFEGWPSAYTLYKNKNLKIIKARFALSAKNIPHGTVYKEKKDILVRCGKNSLKLEIVQLEGKKEVSAFDFINGHQDIINSRLL